MSARTVRAELAARLTEKESASRELSVEFFSTSRRLSAYHAGRADAFASAARIVRAGADDDG